MSRNSRGYSVTGPTSALTDFLASYNISATEIRRTAAERQRLVQQQREQDHQQEQEQTRADAPVSVSSDNEQDSEYASSSRPTTRASQTKGKEKARGKQAASIGKGKGREKAKGKGKLIKGTFDSSDSDDDDDNDSDGSGDATDALCDYSIQDLVGQIEDCQICGKSFSVTPYTKAGPNGGLICAQCNRQRANSVKRKQPSMRSRAVQGFRKRQKDIMDGIFFPGGKSLGLQCIELLVQHMDLADTLVDLPEHQVDKISRLVAKRRLLDNETLKLFVRPRTRTLNIYDGAKLGSEDLIMCFQTCAELDSFLLRNGIQFKDNVMEYLVGRNLPITSFNLHGANLLTDGAWRSLFTHRGEALRALAVDFTDDGFTDDTIETMVSQCPNLEHVSIRHNSCVTNQGVLALSRLHRLRSLSLELRQPISPATYVQLLAAVGNQLESLSLRRLEDADDTLLDAIHSHCRNLRKLRLTECTGFTDGGMEAMFLGWENGPLQYLDLYQCRGLEPQFENGVQIMPAVGPLSFKAMVAHSSSELRHLNIAGARHISEDAFNIGFGVRCGFPKLRYAEFSFCQMLTTETLEKFMGVAPVLWQVIVFGCLNISEGVRVPDTVQIVGMPRVQGMTLGAQTVRA